MTSPTRAGDRDRESTATLLGQALAEGYLDLPEYENRLQTAFTAQTADDLRALTTDLPVAELRRNDPRRRAARRAAVRRSVQLHLAHSQDTRAVLLMPLRGLLRLRFETPDLRLLIFRLALEGVIVVLIVLV